MSWFDRNRNRYPDDWPEIAAAVKDAAGWCCEACGNPHGPSPYVLTTHHLDHDPENRDAVLIALCQRCHLRAESLQPYPTTKAECIERLRARYEAEQAQLRLALDVCAGCGRLLSEHDDCLEAMPA